MTEQERQTAFINSIKALEKRFGITIKAITQPEMLGDVLQVKPTLILVAIPGWREEVNSTTSVEAE
jgi:hypothetical protein